MTRRRPPFVSAACAALALTSTATAEILDTGIDTDKIPDLVPGQPLASGACRVAWYRGGGTDEEIARLQALGHDIDLVSRYEITLSNLLANYDLLFIAYAAPGLLAERQPDIQAFVDLGHALWIHQPNHAGTLDYCPVNLGVTITDPVWCSPDGYIARIDIPGHPIMAGLTNEDLSSAGDRVTLEGAWTVLSSNPTGCESPALAVGSHGMGRVVFETGNAAPLSLVPGTDAYWNAIFEWVCSTGPVGTDRVSWGSLKASYR